MKYHQTAIEHHKKHHKHHKKRRRRISDEVEEDSSRPQLKLKIKLGGQTFSTKNIVVSPDVSEDSEEDDYSNDEGINDNTFAVNKDMKLLTARQKSILENIREKQSKTTNDRNKRKVIGQTEEVLQKKTVDAEKRRMQAQQKKEKQKKITVDKLLKKPECKVKVLGTKSSAKAGQFTPMISYRDSVKTGKTLSMPENHSPFPAEWTVMGVKRKPTRCSVNTCLNLKKYSCSKTGVPLCSLECYRKNLEQQGLK